MRGRHLIGEFLTAQFRRFLLAGGFAACVNIGSRMLYDLFMPYTAAIALAFASGLATGYFTMRRYVFADTERKHSTATARFAVVNLLGLLQTWSVSIALGDYVLPWIGVHSYAHDLAHAVGVATPVFTSFLGHRHWTFR